MLQLVRESIWACLAGPGVRRFARTLDRYHPGVRSFWHGRSIDITLRLSPRPSRDRPVTCIGCQTRRAMGKFGALDADGNEKLSPTRLVAGASLGR